MYFIKVPLRKKEPKRSKPSLKVRLKILREIGSSHQSDRFTETVGVPTE